MDLKLQKLINDIKLDIQIYEYVWCNHIMSNGKKCSRYRDHELFNDMTHSDSIATIPRIAGPWIEKLTNLIGEIETNDPQ